MLLKYGFTVNKLCTLFSENLELNGDKGRKRDAEIIYYYLSQKYSHYEMDEIIENLENIMYNTPEKDIHELLLSFCDNN